MLSLILVHNRIEDFHNIHQLWKTICNIPYLFCFKSTSRCKLGLGIDWLIVNYFGEKAEQPYYSFNSCVFILFSPAEKLV